MGRRVIAPLVAVLLAALLLMKFPDEVYFFGEGSQIVGRPIPMRELACWLLAWAIVAAAAPRFPLWEALGKRSLTWRALAAAAAALVLPVGLYLLVKIPAELMTPGMPDPVVIVGNVLAVAALAVICVCLAGFAWGSVLLLVLVALILHAQAQNIALWALPFTWTFVRNESTGAGFDGSVRWVWMAVLIVAALAVAWFTRMVPPWRKGRL
ncbi:hypothetical protein DDD63_10960 [Actinobaculum sp. 313]|nr:hypothetical protein DDD63_10960 [Actinobaculum sp. 313]